MKRIFIILFGLTLIPAIALSQDSLFTKKTTKTNLALDLINKLKLDKANELYNHLAYSHAVSLYEELASSNYHNKEVYPKLGDCYHNLSNTEKAETWYALAVSIDSIEPVYYYRYAQVLKSNGKYAESENWMKRYGEFNSGDSRLKNLSENKELINQLSSRKSFYKVTERKELNSKYADFGAVILGNKTVFTSGRTENLMVGTYYAWNDKPFLDLYVYDSSSLIKEKITPLSKTVNTRYHEGPVCFSADGKTMYFTRDNYYKGKRSYNKKGTTCLMIFRAELINGIWEHIIPLPFNNKEYSVGHPSLSPDGKKLYFASDMPGSIGGSDIYYVEILGDNQYGTPVNLGPEINTEGNEMFPYVNSDGLYYSSDGLAGLGGLDIFFAKYTGNQTWQKPVNLGSPVNSNKDDFSFVVNTDKRSGFLASNRPGGAGDDDIYSFTLNQMILKGILRDTTNQNQPVENGEVVLLSGSGSEIEKVQTNKNGDYTFDVAFDTKYILKATKTGYIENTKSISTSGAGGELVQDLNIGLDKPFVIFGTISDKKTGEKLSDVDITIIDTLKQSLILDTKTPASGQFKATLKDVQMKSHLAYRVMLRKTGYLAKTVVFDHYISSYETNMNEFLEVSMDKISVGVDIGKLLNINPIYFDLGKWDIRPDAAVELNKIVQAMKDNPTVVIELGSHTDSRGSNQANLDLSDKRAKASAQYIIDQGIDSNRIYGKGYGETKLVNRCRDGVKCTEQEHAQNRRTEFKVVKF